MIEKPEFYLSEQLLHYSKNDLINEQNFITNKQQFE
jgi:hypothetical protein